jgi:alpha-1,3-rhamnosyl/mannosyltransferase
LAFIKEHDLEKQVRILGYVPQEDMPTLYANAAFMVFPSLYEGFGIPLVEAMKAQCPVVCSNRASVPEVVGEAALQFNPDDPKDIAEKMFKLLEPNVRKKLMQKGIERSTIFSWESCAKETLHVFQRVIKGDKQR